MLKDILAISGQPGLYRLISQARNGIIVESLETGKRLPAHASAKISALEDIAIFTDSEEVPLVDVFKNISDKEDGKAAISPKSSGDELKAYFEQILPEYDRDRVYVSDIKKVMTWYNILQNLDLLNFEEVKTEEQESEVVEEPESVEK